MESHRAIVTAADAPEEETIALTLGGRHIAEAPGRVADNLDQRVFLLLLLRRLRLMLRRHHVRVVILRQGACWPEAHGHEGTDQRIPESHRESSDLHSSLLT